MLIISAVKANCYKILFGAKAELVRNGLFIEPCRLCFVNKLERGFSRPLLHFKWDLTNKFL